MEEKNREREKIYRRAEKCSEGSIPATWGEAEAEEEEGGHPWALQNGGFLSPPPHLPHPPPPPLREEVEWCGEIEGEKRMDPHRTDARRRGKETQGKERV